ncbi:MAG: hypothetical protein M1838_001368 [Thelocarpon superellum]|nr:MAG: hypothetical protein M1838_001368 [Thelocarpon superellum]
MLLLIVALFFAVALSVAARDVSPATDGAHRRWAHPSGTVKVARSHKFINDRLFKDVAFPDWACFSNATTGAKRCMPPGRYYLNDVSQGGYEFDWSKVDTVEPPGHGGRVNVMTATGPERNGVDGDMKKVQLGSFMVPDGPDGPFARNMSYAFDEDTPEMCVLEVVQGQVNTFRTASVCLWSERFYRGSFACFGPGAGSLPPGVEKTARSLMVQNGQMQGWFTNGPITNLSGGLVKTFAGGVNNLRPVILSAEELTRVDTLDQRLEDLAVQPLGD